MNNNKGFEKAFNGVFNPATAFRHENKIKETLLERDARYLARLHWREEAVFNNPFERGSMQSLAYTSEAGLIRFEESKSL